MTEVAGKSIVAASIEAVVIRADGTVEDLGVVAEAHFDEDGVPTEVSSDED